TLGRFVSQDPTRLNGHKNLYEYASNNPVYSTPPSGTFPPGPAGKSSLALSFYSPMLHQVMVSVGMDPEKPPPPSPEPDEPEPDDDPVQWPEPDDPEPWDPGDPDPGDPEPPDPGEPTDNEPEPPDPGDIEDP